MINLDEINGEIAKLESQTQTYLTIEKLAYLYIVRDHITLSEPKPSGVISDTGGSEFLSACCGKPTADIMAVFDELMNTLQMIQPRAYEAIMKKLY